MGKRELGERDNGEKLEMREQPVAHALQRGIGENAIGQNNGGSASAGLEERMDPLALR